MLVKVFMSSIYEEQILEEIWKKYFIKNCINFCEFYYNFYYKYFYCFAQLHTLSLRFGNELKKKS